MSAFTFLPPNSPNGSFANYIGADYTNPDLDVLHANYQRSKAAHAALMHGQKTQADADNQLLQSATPDELNNLFGAPRTPREARLQQIVQSDYNAKERGTALIPSWKQIQDYQHGMLANQQLQNEIATGQQNRQFKPMAFQLEQDKFANEKSNQAASQAVAKGHLTLAQQQADDSNYYRDLDYEHKLATEKAAQDRLNSQDFNQLQKNVASGEVSAEDLIQAMPNLTPAQQAVLRSHQNAFNQTAQQAQIAADQWNQRMRQNQPQAQTKTHWFQPNETIQPTQDEINAAQDVINSQFQRDKGAQKLVALNPDTGRFEPLLRMRPQTNSAPAWRGQSQLTGAPDTESYTQPAIPDYSSGSDFVGPQPFVGPPAASSSPQYLEGQDGYLYQVINGRPVKTNMRRRR